MVFFINDNHVSPSYSYKMFCLYSKTPKDFTRVIFNDHFSLMLTPFRFNMDPISSTNFSMNTSSDPIMSSIAIWLIVSSVLLLISYFVCSCDLTIFPLIRLVRMACSWAALSSFMFHALGSNFATIATYLDLPLLSLSYKLSMQHFFFPRNCSFLLLLSLSLYCSFSD